MNQELIDELVSCLQDMTPYARACIGLPENAWPHDNVILRARRAMARVEAMKQDAQTPS